MARIKIEVIEVLRKTAKALSETKHYQWGHMGACNCGFLAQQITRLSKAEIHTQAMQGCGDWSEQQNDYCPTSGYLFDDLISKMIDFGFDRDDLVHLERLSDQAILRQLPAENRNLSYNNKDHVVLYLKTWAAFLEEKLVERLMLPNIEQEEKEKVKEVVLV
jgi:hypothetical protein